MKKMLALILISFMLLSSCSYIDKSGAGSSDELLSFDVLALTSHFPQLEDGYDYKNNLPPTSINYILPMNGIGEKEIKECLTYETDIVLNNTYYYVRTNTENVSNVQMDISGIIDDKNKFRRFYEGIQYEKYSDRFSDNFFKNNILLITYCCGKGFDMPFVKADYSFDSDTKSLNISLTTRPHDGWHKMGETLNLHSIAYIISIAKSDITIDGKLVPYEELNIEVTGKLMLD